MYRKVNPVRKQAPEGRKVYQIHKRYSKLTPAECQKRIHSVDLWVKFTKPDITKLVAFIDALISLVFRYETLTNPRNPINLRKSAILTT
ncbi:MAG: hypothetical protein OXM61_21055 [Candidatus Poribacteria bacterium]|nr:hypothetical protein [Candidatus Poribacteria bacterium]